MKKVIVALVAASLSAGVMAAGDAAAGKNKVAACAGCHGMNGKAMVPNYPSLAGQNAAYLEGALKAYKTKSARDIRLRSCTVWLPPCLIRISQISRRFTQAKSNAVIERTITLLIVLCIAVAPTAMAQESYFDPDTGLRIHHYTDPVPDYVPGGTVLDTAGVKDLIDSVASH